MTTSVGGSAGVDTGVDDGAQPLSDAGGVPDPHSDAPERSSWARRWWSAIRIGVWLAISRVLAGVAVAHAVAVLFPEAVLHSSLGTLSTGTWLGTFDRWDARYYLTIAAHGYPAHLRDVRAFFPGYPLVVRAVHVVTGGAFSYVQVACFVSWVSFLLAAGLLYRLVARHYGVRAALVTAALFCWFPTSVFYLAPYSESLFALAILAVATLIDHRRWWWAAVVAGYASCVSPESAALTAALIVAALVARRGLLRTLGYAVVGSLGALGYVWFLAARFSQPFAFSDVLPDFHRVAILPFVGAVQNIVAIEREVNSVTTNVAILPNLSSDALRSNLVWMWSVDDAALVLAVCAFITLVVVAVRSHRLPSVAAVEDEAARPGVPIAWIVLLAGIMVMASVTVIHTPGGPVSTEGTARLVGVAFPLYPGLYLMVRRWQAPIIVGLGLSVAAAVVTQVMFNLGYWVT